MARKIIILEAAADAVPGEIAYRYALWADVPAARQSRYANATATSAVVGATGPELTAIQNGSVAEKVVASRWPAGTTIPQIQAFLITAFNAWQAQVTAANPWDRYGTSWDGASWTAVNGS